MRGLIRLIVATLSAVAFFAVISTNQVARADGDCPGPVDANGICIGGTDPGTPPTEDPGGNGGENGGTNGCQDADGKTIPCTNDLGWTWSSSHNCYAFMLDPQPDPASPLWGGNDPAEGNIWSCDPTVSIEENTWFLPNGEVPVVDAGEVARDLAERAPFEVAAVNTAPAAPNKTYVGLETWLWIPDDQWHDVSVSVTVQGATVTLVAAPSRVAWDMGDGGSGKSCEGPGRAWVKGMGDSASTTCSYTYNRLSTVNASGKYDPKRAFTVTGGLYYDVGWTCTGNCSAPNGDLGEYPAPTTSTDLIVAERQSVVTQ